MPAYLLWRKAEVSDGQIDRLVVNADDESQARWFAGDIAQAREVEADVADWGNPERVVCEPVAERAPGLIAIEMAGSR